MSAPLTPEQRETLLVMLYDDECDCCPTRAKLTDQQREALHAALSQPARTCGTCHYWSPQRESSLGFCGFHLQPRWTDDGCLLGWRARETDTTP